MKSKARRAQKLGHSKPLHAIVFIVAMLSFALNSTNIRAANVAPMDYRVLAAGGKFDETWQVAATFKMRPPRRLRSRHLELANGSISVSRRDSVFVRAQHTSNGGLNGTNPGMDMFRVNVALDLSHE